MPKTNHKSFRKTQNVKKSYPECEEFHGKGFANEINNGKKASLKKTILICVSTILFFGVVCFSLAIYLPTVLNASEFIQELSNPTVIQSENGQSINNDYNSPNQYNYPTANENNNGSSNTTKSTNFFQRIFSKQSSDKKEELHTTLKSSESINSAHLLTSTTSSFSNNENEKSTSSLPDSYYPSTTKVFTSEPFSTSNSNINNTTSTTKPNSDSLKLKEINEENQRHNQAVAEINDFYGSTINGLQQKIDNIEITYGITNVYDYSYCQSQINRLSREISDLERKISSIGSSTNSSDIAERRRYEQQLKEKQAEQNLYYKHLSLLNYYSQLEEYKKEYEARLSSENQKHSSILASIEAKYAN